MKTKEYPVLDKKYILRQYRINDDERIVIYGLNDNTRVELNKDSAFVVSSFDGENSIEDILEKIMSNYDKVTHSDASESLLGIVNDLTEKKIVYLNDQKQNVRKFPPLIDMRGALDSVYIRTTNACNLRCKHCSVDASFNKSERLSNQQLFNILDQLHELMVPTVTFTGGEPTLVESLPDLIKYAHEKPVRPILMTNGIRITKHYAEELVKNGLAQVNVSIDGYIASTHDDFRGQKGSYKKALDAIEIFKELGIYVETTTVINETNVSELDDIVSLGEKYELNNMKFLPVIPFKRGKECNYNEALKGFQLNLGKFIFKYGDKDVFEKNISEELTKRNISRCSAALTVLSINYNGDILPCNNFDPIVLGNIKEQTLYNIYNHSPKLGEVDEAISILGSECAECPILNSCHGGCVMISHSFYNTYKKCDITRKAIVSAIRNNQPGD